jgi:hypothetical protein
MVLSIDVLWKVHKAKPLSARALLMKKTGVLWDVVPVLWSVGEFDLQNWVPHFGKIGNEFWGPPSVLFHE